MTWLKSSPPNRLSPAEARTTEVDLVLRRGREYLAIEVKAGPGGAMRSLHQFMADRDLSWAVRFNSAPPMRQPIDTVTSIGQAVRYELLSLPAYAVECLPRLAKEMDANVQG